MITRNLRLALDYGIDPNPDSFGIIAHKAVALEVDIAVFNKGVLDDLANLTGIIFRAMASRHASTNLIYSLQSTLDTSVTIADWLDGLDEHATISLSAADMNVAMTSATATNRTLYCVVEATRASGGNIPLGEGHITLLKTGATADPPGENPGAAITEEEADARYLRGYISDGGGAFVIQDEDGVDLGWVTITAGEPPI